jgi:uncharacterized protein YndB with AHSA1/START domain
MNALFYMLLGLRLQEKVNQFMSVPSITITIYIASTPEKVWSALTDPNITERYWGGTRIESDWCVGSKVIYRREGKVVDEHELLTCEPPLRFSHTFHPLFGEFASETPSRVAFELVPGGSVVQLTMTHDTFPEGSKVYPACGGAWPMLLSSLKTLLETGKPLPNFKS